MSVTDAARMLGVHPNTIRAWSDQGRLRYFRINVRGDRRYLVRDLERFLEESTGRPVGLARPGREPRGRVAMAPTAPFDGFGVVPAARPDEERRARELEVMREVARLSSGASDLGAMLRSIAALLRRRFRYRLVAFFEIKAGRFVVRAGDGIPPGLPDLPVDRGLLGAAAASRRTVCAPDVRDDPRYVPAVADVSAEIVVPILVGDTVWGVLDVEDDRLGLLSPLDGEVLTTVCQQVAVAVLNRQLLERVQQQLHQAEALHRVAADISSNLDLDSVLWDLIDHASALFGANRAAVFLPAASGQVVARVSRGLSDAYLDAVRDFPKPSLPALAIADRRPLASVHYADDPRGAGVRHAVVQEGFDSLAVGPLLAEETVLGLLILYHDEPRPYDHADLDALAALAAQASVAIKNAQNYAQMATWAAQLQSIQLLGARLSRLTSVRDIGLAIAAELHRLIEYHNVRVYRVEGEDVVPVAWHGQIGEYAEETEEQLRLKVGEGITGWVAQHGIPQNVADAAHDPRARTIPGTAADLEESLLVVPMSYEDRVIGVIVLSKLGLRQFADDDLRLLVIYASFAAQAMASADATERLRAQSARLAQQLRSQQELLEITESLLTTLDFRVVLDQVGERLGAVVPYDNLAIAIYDPPSQTLRPLIARGRYAETSLARPLPVSEGITGWVFHHGEAQLVPDMLADPRVSHFNGLPPEAGSLIAAPLRGPEGVIGVLFLERLGSGPKATFTDEAFELVKLFAAHASIAMQNAEVYRAVEIRAQTDGLTGLKNHATFQESLVRAVARGERFSLLMLDLDDFKAYNDKHGHQAGDRFLRAIAESLLHAGRETDQVFRYGGDEFALILPNTDSHGARAVADKVVAVIAQAARSLDEGREKAVAVSASIGLATFPQDGTDHESVLLAADRACYVAKRGGRARIATAEDGRALASEFMLTAPTPVDLPATPDGAGGT